MKQRLRVRSIKKGKEANSEKKKYIYLKNQQNNNNNEKREERKGTKWESNPAPSSSPTSPYHYTTKDDYVSLVKSL